MSGWGLTGATGYGAGESGGKGGIKRNKLGKARSPRKTRKMGEAADRSERVEQSAITLSLVRISAEWRNATFYSANYLCMFNYGSTRARGKSWAMCLLELGDFYDGRWMFVRLRGYLNEREIWSVCSMQE